MSPSDTVVAPRFAGTGTVVAPTPDEPLFELRGIHKAFGELVLFEDTSLTVRRGETLSIIGESGCGKSVWLKMMIGLVPIDAGEIYFRGDNVLLMGNEGLARLRRSVGYLFQNGALFDSMTVLDNVGYALREHTTMGDEQIRERVITCLEKVNLSRRILDQWPAELSGGMRKRVALARAIAIEPEVVLYDEPTQGLDPQSITIIAELISELQRDLDITSVLVTHDMRCAFSVSDRIAMVHERGFPYVGTPTQLGESTAPAVQEYISEALEELQSATPPE
ncbi:MAG: ATP-binding cassette domain-containing protein [Myxococcales bacterium]|nr:ATP-binding cassette domain-containing protein [Myxococcales bacterium]MCB9714317.1 ATP-binding cassette domain-containing protein [Myxococcales bacterium]